MRGEFQDQGGLFSYINPEKRPAGYALQAANHLDSTALTNAWNRISTWLRKSRRSNSLIANSKTGPLSPSHLSSESARHLKPVTGFRAKLWEIDSQARFADCAIVVGDFVKPIQVKQLRQCPIFTDNHLIDASIIPVHEKCGKPTVNFCRILQG